MRDAHLKGDRMMGTLTKALALGLVAGLLGAGCAQPEEINRVQPNLIKKSDLAGEWYLMDTVVQAPYASAQFFPGLQGKLERGVFEIEENTLFFYRTYEFVEGLESQGIRQDGDTPLLDADGNPVTYTKTMPDGSEQTVTRYVFRSSPLAAWSITGHYDIRKSYNPMTGEPSNVTVEDASEKYWWQRKYMRVNFGQDNAPTSSRFTYWPWFHDVVYEGDTGPEGIKLRIEDDGNYMDYVIKGFISAPTTYLDGWGYIPTCLFYPWYTGAYYECAEEEIQIRTAFKRVPAEDSYKPLDYDDHMLNKFGFFRQERSRWDEQYGITFSDAIRHIGRFNLWADYVEGADGKPDYAAMTPKPIVYYLSERFPRELIPGAMSMVDEWNEVFTEVVSTLQGSQYDGRMVVLCENNLNDVADFLDADPNALLAETEAPCRDMDKPKYRGDIRYNLIVSVDEPVEYGLYGYGPSASDPLTGETISATANIYTANIRLGARNAVDQIEYAAGVQNFKDITQAQHIRTGIKARTLKNKQNGPRRAVSIQDAETVAENIMVPEVAKGLTGAGVPTTDVDWAQAGMRKLLDADDFSWVWLNQDTAAMVGLPVDHMGQQPDDNHFLRDIVHPASLASADMLHWDRRRQAERGKAAICMAEDFDDSFAGLALEYKPLYDQAMCDGLRDRDDLVFDFSAFDEPGVACDDDASVCAADQECRYLDQGDIQGKFCMTPCSTGALLDQLRKEIRRVNQVSEFTYWDPNALYTATKDARVEASQHAARDIIEPIREQVFLDVYNRIWSKVTLHEVGHNLGLRHNFAGSTDALNYFPEYWKLEGEMNADGQWAPKHFFGRETEDQVRGRIREYQQSSIMDYGSAFNSDFQGLGAYDRAAIFFGYGQLVETFDNPPDPAKWTPYLAEPTDDDPGDFGLYPRREAPLARALRKIHYTNYPEIFGSVENMEKRTVVPFDSLFDFDRPCSELDNPYDTTVCGDGSFCRPYLTGSFCTKPNVVEVPYRFCSDEYNWTSPTCQTWDEGTDMYQMVINTIDDYENYWPFRAYQRDNDLFNPSTTYWRRVNYTMSYLRKQFEHWAYAYAQYNKNDWWEKKFGKPWHMDVNGGLGQTLAAKEIFEMMANVFGRPSDGYYGWNADKGRYEPVVNNGKNNYTNIFQLREDQGARPMYPGYDYSGYLYVPARAGAIYDRMAAFQYMAYPNMIFLGGVDNVYDMRRFRMSFATVWPQRMQNIFAGLVTGEPAMFGWCIEHDGVPPTEGGNGDPSAVKQRKWFGTSKELDAFYSNCVPLQPEPEYTFLTTQYRIPALALIYGMGWMSNTYDRTFVDRSRLWLDGEGNDLNLPEGMEVMRYTDPFSGKTYEAPYDPAEFDPMAPVTPRSAVPSADFAQHGTTYWPAAALLAWANDKLTNDFPNSQSLSSDYQFSELQQLVGRLEIVRGLFSRFEYGY